ncbi:hypothetical protein TA3x_004186 [Tundrisphaera sp. TA3]|uniref:hypothetical protein n=1 Tax=Tundrisphaera sp. TA3 TaxID=3435775 RepID=UPI003EBD979C
MLLDGRNSLKHRPWIVSVVAASLIAAAWYAFEGYRTRRWPSGGSLPGLTLGIVGGLLILFEFSLWGRKKVRAWRIGRARTWMIAHIWLGLLTVPMLVLHSGFRWGGSLSTVLMVLFLVVIASGVWGLAMQQILPGRMLERVPAETIHSQIGLVAKALERDAQRLVAVTCGPAPGEEPEKPSPEEVAAGAPISHLTVGAVQTVGEVQGKTLITRVQQAAVPGAGPLRDIYRDTIGPFLLQGKAIRSPLNRPALARSVFDDLRAKLPAGAHEAVGILENSCEQRRQLDLQARYHTWLHNWLAVHLPLSVALVILMFVHIWVALQYR